MLTIRSLPCPQGDEAFVRQDYAASVEAYTVSFRHDTSFAVVWANRAAALLRLGEGARPLSPPSVARRCEPGAFPCGSISSSRATLLTLCAHPKPHAACGVNLLPPPPAGPPGFARSSYPPLAHLRSGPTSSPHTRLANVLQGERLRRWKTRGGHGRWTKALPRRGTGRALRWRR